MFESILGLAMFYCWIHGSIIVGLKIKGATKYEKVVLVCALSSIILFVLGSL